MKPVRIPALLFMFICSQPQELLIKISHEGENTRYGSWTVSSTRVRGKA
uniref:Uncharacterized protein n=1 Tax=Anguilla anguilla TaxID=7936 RepID=A0A0E9T4U7_ANGAN